MTRTPFDAATQKLVSQYVDLVIPNAAYLDDIARRVASSRRHRSDLRCVARCSGEPGSDD